MADPAVQPAMQEGTFCHIEIPVGDLGKAKKFFGNLFGWTFQDVPMGDSTYVIYTTREGSVGGGMWQRTEDSPKHPVNYILVNDIKAYEKKIVDAGGKVVMQETEIPGFGSMLQFTDPDGNLLALWKPG